MMRNRGQAERSPRLRIIPPLARLKSETPVTHNSRQIFMHSILVGTIPCQLEYHCVQWSELFEMFPVSS
jgi:hypothetical protein